MPINEKEPHVDIGDFSLTLERKPCHGSCPYYRVNVDSSGTVKWEGYLHVSAPGPFVYKISPAQLTWLIAFSYKADVFNLKDDYREGIGIDLGGSIITVNHANQHKKIIHDHGDVGVPVKLNIL